MAASGPRRRWPWVLVGLGVVLRLAALPLPGSLDVSVWRTPGGAVFEHRKLVAAVQKLVGYVRQPSLIVHPLEDDYAALSNATYLRDGLKGPVDLVVLDDCYHIVTVDRQRHLVVEAIDRFVSALSPVRSGDVAAVPLAQRA